MARGLPGGDFREEALHVEARLIDTGKNKMFAKPIRRVQGDGRGDPVAARIASTAKTTTKSRFGDQGHWKRTTKRR